MKIIIILLVCALDQKWGYRNLTKNFNIENIMIILLRCYNYGSMNIKSSFGNGETKITKFQINYL